MGIQVSAGYCEHYFDPHGPASAGHRAVHRVGCRPALRAGSLDARMNGKFKGLLLFFRKKVTKNLVAQKTRLGISAIVGLSVMLSR